jgi:hypothetical protein
MRKPPGAMQLEGASISPFAGRRENINNKSSKVTLKLRDGKVLLLTMHSRKQVLIENDLRQFIARKRRFHSGFHETGSAVPFCARMVPLKIQSLTLKTGVMPSH